MGLDARRVCLVGIEVQVEDRARRHANDHITELELAVAADLDPDEVVIVDPEPVRIVGAHVDMAPRDDRAVRQRQHAARTAQLQARCALQVTGFAHGRRHTELDGIGACELDLGLGAEWADDRDMIELALGPDDIDRLDGDVLTGL